MCASRLMRRSGIACGITAELLDFVPDRVVQVGIGYHHEEALVLAEEWPNCLFTGYEAHPGIVKNLKDYPGEVIEVAISDEIGTKPFFIKKRHGDGSSLFEYDLSKAKNVEEIQVRCSTLDNFWSNVEIGKALLWLDCEGGELDAMRGGVELLKKIQLVNLEMTSCPPGSGWCSIVETHAFLEDHGFYQLTSHSNRSSAGQADFLYVKHKWFLSEYCTNPWEITRHAAEVGKYEH